MEFVYVLRVYFETGMDPHPNMRAPFEPPAAAGPGRSLRACGAAAVLATAVLVMAAACFEGAGARRGMASMLRRETHIRRFLGDNGGCRGHGANRVCPTPAPNPNATNETLPPANETSGNETSGPSCSNSEWCKCAESQTECACNGLVVLGNVDNEMFSDVRRVNGTIFCSYLTLGMEDPAREKSP